jgi:superfamily II DNA or RNA helicase
MKTYLGRKGYTICLKDFTKEKINKIKEDLTFTPFQPKGYGPDPIPFSIFGISENKMFLPKFYGIPTFGPPNEIKISPGEPIKLTFNGILRENQKEPVECCLKSAKESGGGILCLPCGWGKCLGINTPVLMYDGSIKMVQDIEVCDLVMGDDSKPRTILSICKGKEQLYKVISEHGESYTVNESHILSLVKNNEIIDISVKDYLLLDNDLLGYKVPIDFPEKKIEIDPYIIGLWFGKNKKYEYYITDISKDEVYINTNSEIFKYLINISKKDNKLDVKYKEYLNFFYIICCRHSYLYELNQYSSIPILFKCNSREIRLQILAGIIDTNKYCPLKNGYTVYNTEKIIDDVIYISRSLGFSAYKNKTMMNSDYNYKTIIYGNGISDIPIHINKRKYDKDCKNVLQYKIYLEKLEIGDYYGFEIDGNHRYLLGDFTVTHNTSISLYLIVELGVKALIIVNKEFLMDQWKERIQQFIPNARIGLLRQKKIDIQDKDIVIGMLQSIAMCKYDSSIYDSFGITFYDEVHCVPSKIFSKALRKINTRYHFGLSATPNRQDGMTKVTNLYIGPIIYKVDTRKEKKNPKNVHVFTVSFDNLPEGKLYKNLLNYQGKPDVVKMISNITQCQKRLKLISIILRYFIKDKRHILVLSDRIQYLRDIEEQINKDLLGKIPFKIGYYIGGMKEKERKESEKSDLLLASYSMAKEAMDIPILDTLLMVTSKSNIEQSIGRIQRKMVYPDERPPLVIDFLDNFSSFKSQYNKRVLFYKKNNYTMFDFLFNNETTLCSELNECIQSIKENKNMENMFEEVDSIDSVNVYLDNDCDSKISDSLEKKTSTVQTKIDRFLKNKNELSSDLLINEDFF